MALTICSQLNQRDFRPRICLNRTMPSPTDSPPQDLAAANAMIPRNVRPWPKSTRGAEPARHNPGFQVLAAPATEPAAKIIILDKINE
jgi:hypothetical protein